MAFLLAVGKALLAARPEAVALLAAGPPSAGVFLMVAGEPSGLDLDGGVGSAAAIGSTPSWMTPFTAQPRPFGPPWPSASMGKPFPKPRSSGMPLPSAPNF